MTIETLLPMPDLFSAKQVLCIQPHYDDNDIAAGGTIRLLREQGAEISYITVTDDLVGVVDDSLSNEAAAAFLKRDQYEAGEIVGVKAQYWLDYPDAGKYDHYDVRGDLLKYIRMIAPDFVFTVDPWLTYEGHRDHVKTGLAATEAVIFADITKIPSSDEAVDAAYKGHIINGVVYYYTREPNYIVDISETWDTKIEAVKCYKAQFEPADMDRLIMALEMKSSQIAQGLEYNYCEPLKVLHPDALHCGF